MNLKDVLAANGFTFTKRFGQNFISDTNLLEAIVQDAGVTATDTVLEIGAGAGTLTGALARTGCQVVAYEIDTALQPVLAETLAEYPNAEVVFKDFMKEDIATLKTRFAHAKIVANLPYYVTTPILMRLIEEGIGQQITVMVQQEVAERLVAEAGTKDYGAITARIRLFGDATITRIVNRRLFFPAPNVDSAVVNITHRTTPWPDEHPQLTAKLIRVGFAMRRKTLCNNLMQLPLTRDQALQALSLMGLDPNVRGETLSAQQYIALASAVHTVINQ